MSLRKTALIVVLMTFLGLTLVLLTSLRTILFAQFNYQEQQTVLADLQVVQKEFDRLSNDQLTSAWAFLQDSFKQTFDPITNQWILPELNTVWRDLPADWLAVVTRSGRVISAQSDPEKSLSPTPDELAKIIAPLENVTLWQNGESRTGIMNVSGRLFLISAVPIPANSTSPAQIFISGRWISNTDLVRFSALLRLSIRLSPYRDDLQTTLETETLNSVTLDKPFTFLNLNQQTIGGIYLVNDINQKPAFVLTFDQPRTLYRTGQILFIYMLIALVSTTLIFAIITILLIDRAFVSRLLHLNSQVKEIGSSHDISQRVSTRGNDEISGLGREINQMLSKLQINQRRLVEIQEEERRHVALELHDEIGQMLTGLKILLETLPNLDKEKALDRHKQALEHSNELIQRVRSLSLDLRPALLDDLGLIPALEWLFTRLSQQANLKIEFRHDHLAGVRFAPSLEITGYRLVQEALTNIVRHSGVSQASVQLWKTRDLLVIQVEDQGKGFIPAEEINGGKSSGLQGMRERVALLGGRLTIDSSPNQGVLLLAELPLNQGD